MKILVTGTTGFLGNRFCEQLNHSDYDIIATGRNTRAGIKLQSPNIKFIAGDLTDNAFAQQVARDCEAIVHCAALSTIWSSYNQFHQANVVVVNNLLSAAKKYKIPRFIHISTPSVYVGSPIKEGITENTKLPRKFANDYIKTKKMSEDLLLDAAKQGLLQTIILRPQGIFGPNDSSIIPRLLNANDHGGIPLIKGGQHKIDVTYIDNVCHAMKLSLHSRDTNDANIYNITNGEPTCFLEILQKIFTSIQHPLNCKPRPYWLLKLVAHLYEKTYKFLHVKNEPPLTNYTLSIMSESRTLDISAAQEKLGYKPIVTLDEGISRYAQWYRQRHTTDLLSD